MTSWSACTAAAEACRTQAGTAACHKLAHAFRLRIMPGGPPRDGRALSRSSASMPRSRTSAPTVVSAQRTRRASAHASAGTSPACRAGSDLNDGFWGGAGRIMNDANQGLKPTSDLAGCLQACSAPQLAARSSSLPGAGGAPRAAAAAARLQRPLLRRARGGVAGHGRVEQEVRGARRRGQAGSDRLHLRRLLTYLFYSYLFTLSSEHITHSCVGPCAGRPLITAPPGRAP